VIAKADGPSKQERPEVRVVTKEVTPFVFKEGGRLTGFSIDLWEDIAQQAGLGFEYVEVTTVGEQLGAVETGDADLAIAAISITKEREERVDFSYPYYTSGLLIMTPVWSPLSIRKLTQAILSPVLLYTLGGLGLIMLLLAHIVWLIERKTNPGFSETYFPGVWEAFWWTAVTVTTVGYGDKTTKRVLGRVLAIVWMFAGILLIAEFTAVVTTQLTLAGIQGRIRGIDDLRGNRVVTVVGSTASDFLDERRVAHRTVRTIEEAYQLMNRDRADAIVYDAPVLRFYANNEGQGKVQLVGPVFRPENYGIALPPDSPLRERINLALLEVIENGEYDETYVEWFGELEGP
jgi:ABC-type amino acid transport substrate-binding protein